MIWIFGASFLKLFSARTSRLPFTPHLLATLSFMSFTVPALLPHPLPPRRLLCLLPQGHVNSCDHRHQHGLQHSCRPKGEHAGRCLAEYKRYKTVFNRRWKLALTIPPNLLKLNWKIPKAITTWIISHIVWCGEGFSGGSSPRRGHEHIGMFSVRQQQNNFWST